MWKKIKKALKNPRLIGLYLLASPLGRLISDRPFLQMKYRLSMGKKLNLDNPITYTEKLQWLKLYDRRPIYTTMVDKYAAKEYVSKVLGEEYVVKTYGVWDKFDDIDFDALPNKFVLKCTHDSGNVVICTDKASFDVSSAKKKLCARLHVNYYYYHREWPYKNVPPRFIAEEYLEEAQDKNSIVSEYIKSPDDFKFLCFNGEPKILMIEKDRFKGSNGHTVDFFDMDFNHLEFTVDGYPNSATPIAKPQKFDEMVRLARQLTVGIPQIRMDFYCINDKIYFGEFTFYHASGMFKPEPENWDEIMGSWIELPEKTV